MFDADQIIYEAAAERINTASLAQRRRILQALMVKITVSHPAWKNVSTQLSLIETMTGLQEQLPLQFSTAAKPEPEQPKHNGDD